MAETPFIRVRDKRTKHEFDVHEQAFDKEIHEELKEFPRVSRARADVSYVREAYVAKPKKTSTRRVVEGVSPAGEKLATLRKPSVGGY